MWRSYSVDPSCSKTAETFRTPGPKNGIRRVKNVRQRTRFHRFLILE